MNSNFFFRKEIHLKKWTRKTFLIKYKQMMATIYNIFMVSLVKQLQGIIVQIIFLNIQMVFKLKNRNSIQLLHCLYILSTSAILWTFKHIYIRIRQVGSTITPGSSKFFIHLFFCIRLKFFHTAPSNLFYCLKAKYYKGIMKNNFIQFFFIFISVFYEECKAIQSTFVQIYSA